MTYHAEGLAASRLFLTADDVMLIKRIARGLPPFATVIDLGVGAGTTALSVLEAHPTLTVLSIDISQDNINWASKAIENAGFSDRWSAVCCSASMNVWSEYDLDESELEWDVAFDLPIDLLMLDASHLYEETKAELELWVPRIRPGGWLWCHDYVGDGGLPDQENGVKRAVDEYTLARAHLFPHGPQYAGLGIAFKLDSVHPLP